MYQHHWDTFKNFQTSQLQDHTFPATPNSIALFIVHLSQKNLAVRTIRTYISALSYIHKINDQLDPTTSFLVTKTLQGLKNQTAPSQRSPLRPITRDILYILLDTIPFGVQTQFDNTMWSAIFHLCYHACLRVGEAVVSTSDEHTLHRNQIQLTNSHIIINFKSYKHSGQSTPTVTILSDPNPSRCPVIAVRKYFDIRPATPGPFFIGPHSTPVNRLMFSTFLKTVLALTHLQPDHYNTHSFRIGRTTQLAQDQHNQETIRSAGRWKSSAYLQYIRTDNVQLPR